MQFEEEDKELDAMLRGHLAGKLDGQVGNARRAFEAHVQRSTIARDLRGPHWLNSRAWKIGLFVGAAAATLAAVWMLPRVWRQQQPVVVKHVAPDEELIAGLHGIETVADSAIAPKWEEVQQVVSTLALDKGVVMLEGETPARVVRNVSMERTQWYDERKGVSVEVEVPHEKTILLPVDTY